MPIKTNKTNQTEKLYRHFIIDHNRPKSIKPKIKSKPNQSNQTKSETKSNQEHYFYGSNKTTYVPIYPKIQPKN